MAVYIDWNDKIILECSKSIIEELHQEMEIFILKNKTQLNEALTEVMLKLDQAGYGIGFNLAKYLHTKEDILTFIHLVRKGIDRCNQEYQDYLQNTEDLLEKFYKKLVKLGESFPGNVILRCEETSIDVLRFGTESLIRENKITLHENLTGLMKDLDQARSRLGLPLAEYLHTKEDFIAFTDLVRKSIDRYYQEPSSPPQYIQDSMEGFYQELVKIAESFPD